MIEHQLMGLALVAVGVFSVMNMGDPTSPTHAVVQLMLLVSSTACLALGILLLAGAFA